VTLVALDLRLAGGLLGGTGDIDEARTMAFTTLVLAQLFNCFNARSDRVSAFHHLFTNRWLWGAIALSIVPGCSRPPRISQRGVRHHPARTRRLLICVGLASLVLWADEAKKLVERMWLGR
jgi:magnesium-transporting ATPase (P-type)